jgi:hypothetical protein
MTGYKLIFGCYQQLASRPDVEMQLPRALCFPAVVIAVLKHPTASFDSSWVNTFTRFAADPQLCTSCCHTSLFLALDYERVFGCYRQLASRPDVETLACA